MKLLLLLLMLGGVTVLGFPDRRLAEKDHQGLKDTRVRQAQGCKPKCPSTWNIGQKAAAEAKAAHAAQNAAGAQAAHMVKTQLAEKALQAAKQAEAALAEKKAVVELLLQVVKEAESVVAEDTAALQQQQNTVNVAAQVARQTSAQYKLMLQATQLSAQLEKTAHYVLEQIKSGLQDKSRNLSGARARLDNLQHKLQCACAECSATKQAAHAACEAARAACGNARKKKHVDPKEIPIAIAKPKGR